MQEKKEDATEKLTATEFLTELKHPSIPSDAVDCSIEGTYVHEDSKHVQHVYNVVHLYSQLLSNA